MSDVKKLLELRKAQKAKKPHFLRQDFHKKARLAQVWRRPKGVDSKLRKHMHGHGALPATGYRSPAEVRGMHKSGLIPIMVKNVKDLENADPKKNGVIIASSVGKKKKIDIITAAQAKSVRVFNYKDSAKFIQAVKTAMESRKKTAATKTAKKLVRIKARLEPINTARGDLDSIVKASVANWVLSPSSAKKMIPKVVNIIL